MKIPQFIIIHFSFYNNKLKVQKNDANSKS